MIEKEAQVWHMDTLRHKESYYQCVQCGNIHKEYDDEMIDLDTDIYYATTCRSCRELTKHLCVGDTEDEIYELYDNTLDSRFYY